MSTCHVPPDDKKALISKVGEQLVRTHGKQKYYKPEQVRRAAFDAGYAIDWHCWAMCIYVSPGDFDDFHQAAGEICDYAAMRSEVLTDLAGGGVFSALDLDLSWLDWPDIDLSGLFDWF